MALLGMFKKKKPKEGMAPPPTPDPGMKLEFPSPEDFASEGTPESSEAPAEIEKPIIPREADVAAPPLPKELSAGGEPEFPLPSTDTGAMAEKETPFDFPKVSTEKEEVPMVKDEGMDILNPTELRHMPAAEESSTTSLPEEIPAANEELSIPKTISVEAEPKMPEMQAPADAPIETPTEPSVEIPTEAPIETATGLQMEAPMQVMEEPKPKVAKPIQPMIEPHKEEPPKLMKHGGTSFVSISNFAAIVNTGHEITDDVHLSDDIFFRISELNNTELEKLDKWIAGLEKIEQNLQYIEEKLFSQGG